MDSQLFCPCTVAARSRHGRGTVAARSRHRRGTVARSHNGSTDHWLPMQVFVFLDEVIQCSYLRIGDTPGTRTTVYQHGTCVAAHKQLVETSAVLLPIQYVWTADHRMWQWGLEARG
jgi:hypothetical protein